MKNRKTLTEVEIVELPILPEGWKWAKLGEIAYINSGSTPKNLDKSENKGQFPFYKISDMNSEGNEIWMKNSNLYLSIHEKVLLKVKEEKKGTIIFPKRGGAILTNKKRRLSCNAAYDLNIMGVKEASNCISNEFLWYWFLKLDLRKLYDGSNVPQINNKDIEPLYFPLPPLPEQRAIVSKIEQLFSELDNGIANLRLAQEQLKVYRQAVLKKAFEGELTRKWREQQTNLPDARGLLEQIRKEIEEAAKASGKKVKPVKPLTEDELAELPGLPEGWGWVKIGEVLEVFVGSTPSRKEPKFWGGDIPWVSSGEVAFCKINSTKEFITKLGLENSSTQIHPIGTVMLGMIGEGKTRGQVAILNINACHNQNTAAIRIGSNYLSEFVYHLFEKNYNETRRIGSGNNQQALNKNIIENISIPLCSLPEQHAIVREIETRLSVCDKMAQDIDEALEKAEALRQSILKKAFEGKLLSERELAEVRMAEDWEPADVLLERIRAERAGNGKK